MRDAALAAIGVYQRYVSPHKGFCCAYRVHTGRASCSSLGARAIRRWGPWRGLAVLQLRLRRCGDLHRHCVAARPHRPLAAQRGECDLGLPDLDCGDVTDCCDVADGCGGCDWPTRRSPASERAEARRRSEEARRRHADERRRQRSAGADAGLRRDD